MHLRRIAAALIIAASGALPGFADLADFERRVENAEAVPDRREDPEEEKPDTRTAEEKQADADLFTAFLQLWFYLNFAVDYGGYPYGDGPYVRFRVGDDSPWKFYRFSVGADAYLTADSRLGGRAELEGKIIPFIGPRLDVAGLSDGENEQYFVGLGAQVSFFQTRWVCMDFYGQWVAMRGLVEREGGAGGFVLTIYPGARLGIVMKLGGQGYTSGLDLTEWSCSIGRHFGRYEIYGGWRSLSSEAERLIGGAFLGCRAHF